MPRYLLVVTDVAPEDRARARRVAASAYPELDLVVDDPDSGGARAVWSCGAPSRAHVDRWATAVGLELDAVAVFDGDPGFDGPSDG